jgi:uncharacterized protein with HEPN domain
MRREELYLNDILESAASIKRFLIHKTRNDFDDDEKLQSAVLYKLMVIGEAAARLSDNIKSRYPAAEWRSIIGFRNLAVHVYFSVQWDIVWETATNDVPMLQGRIAEIIQKEYPDFDPNSE